MARRRSNVSIVFSKYPEGKMGKEDVAKVLRLPIEDIEEQWPYLSDRSGMMTRRSFARYLHLRLMPPDEQSGLARVYFIHAPAANLIKIGYTTNLKTRFVDIQNGSPIPLVLLRSIDGGRATEAALHKRFAKLRRRGEWFKATKTLTDFVRSIVGRDEVLED